MRFHSTEFDLYPIASFLPRPGGRMTLEGGKGNNIPAPDPQLIAAQIKSMGIQDDVIQKIMQQSADMQPLQQEQMQFGLDAARSAYDQSQQDREWTLGRRDSLAGLQNQLISDAAQFNQEDRAEQMRGEAYGDVNQAFGSARDQNTRAMARMGVNPSDGKMAAMGNQMAMSQANALASAGQKVGAAARTEGYALTDRATNALAGYPAMGMQATGAGAGYGGMGLQTANAGLASMNSGFGAAGGMAGSMGQNATSMWGQQANAYSNDQNAAGAGMAGLGSAVGGIAMAI